MTASQSFLEDDDFWSSVTRIGGGTDSTDRSDMAMRPDELSTSGEPLAFSEGIRAHPVTSEWLDEAIEAPTTVPDVKAVLKFGLTYLMGNGPDRRVQPYRDGGYDLEDLFIGKGTDYKQRQAQLKHEVENYRRWLDVETTGPIIRTVVFHDPGAQQYVPELAVIDGRVVRGRLTTAPKRSVLYTPGGELVGEQTLVAWPVPVGWSSRRVARLIFRGGTCQFGAVSAEIGKQCGDEWGTASQVLIVTCGARTHLAPICDTCRSALDNATRPVHWISSSEIRGTSPRANPPTGGCDDERKFRRSRFW